MISQPQAAEADLVTIDAGGFTSNPKIVCTNTRTRIRKAVAIGRNAQVSAVARVNPGCRVEPRGVIGHQTVAYEDVVVQSDTTLLGCPRPVVFQCHPDCNVETPRPSTRQRVRFWLQPVIRLGWVFCLSFVALIPSYELAAWAFYGDAEFYDDAEYHSGLTGSSPWKPPMRREYAILGVLPVSGLVALLCVTIVGRLGGSVIAPRIQIQTLPVEDASGTTDLYMIQYFLGKLIVGPYLAGSRFAALHFAWWGAWIEDSRTILINNTEFADASMLTFRGGCVLDVGVMNGGHRYTHGSLEINTKTIGHNCILHPYALTWANDHVPDGIILGPRSQLATTHGKHDEESPTTKLPPGTYVQGCPATMLPDKLRFPFERIVSSTDDDDVL